MEKTANRLKQLREKTGLNQSQLAKKIGISEQSISKYERGERVAPNWIAIAVNVVLLALAIATWIYFGAGD